MPFVFLHQRCTILVILWAFATRVRLVVTYESPRSLDRYGNAVQLQNAQAASSQQGRLIVVVRFQRSLWVLSPIQAKGQQYINSKLARSSPGSSSLQLLKFVNPLLPPPLSNEHRVCHNPGTVAIVCSGIQADAEWLVRQLWDRHGKAVWDRYDSPLSLLATSESVARLMRSFWNYDSQRCWKPFYHQPDDDSSSNSWARPLGVTSLVLQSASSTLSSPSRATHPQVLLIDPSGVMRPRHESIVCIGKHSDETQLFLEDRLKDIDAIQNEQELQDVLLQALRKHFPSADHVVIEVLSEGGTVEQKTVPMKKVV